MTNRKLVFYISCKIKYLLILFKLVTIFVISMSLTISFDQIYASTDPILITQSTGLHDVIFDGKWIMKLASSQMTDSLTRIIF